MQSRLTWIVVAFAVLAFIHGCGSPPKPEVNASSAADYYNKTHDLATMIPDGHRFKEGSAKDVEQGKIQIEDTLGRKFQLTASQQAKGYEFGVPEPIR